MQGNHQPQPSSSDHVGNCNFVEDFQFSPTDYDDLFKSEPNVTEEYNIF